MDEYNPTENNASGAPTGADDEMRRRMEDLQRNPYAQAPDERPNSGQGWTPNACPDNNMGLAIFTTICCCLPLGIFAIIRASKVETYWLMKQYDMATKAAEEAKKYSLIGIVVGVVVNVIYFGLMMIQMYLEGGF